jgi:hypothetical protein
MTNSTRLIGLIMTATLWAGAAAAQELSEWEDSMPPDLSLPSAGADELPLPSLPGESDQSVLMGPTADHEQPFDGYQADGYAEFAPGLHDSWHSPDAPIESTGTWFRRGFWYAEADAVVWNRLWNRDNKLFAAQDPDVNNPLFFFNFIQSLSTNRVLYVDGAHPGEDASVRATLGHFLFRDSKNRDHTVEFTAFAGGDWHQHRQISSSNPFGLFVPFMIDGGNRSFDNGNGATQGSSHQQLDYSSHYSSFEGNYRVRQRLRRDRLVMDANGHWHRAANAGFVREYLAGLRIVEARDFLDWQAQDIEVLGADGSYLIRTDNDMFGLQLGAGFTYEGSRWSLGIQAKGGVYLNDALGRTTLDFTADDADDADLRLRENQLSFLGEAKLLGRWHLTPSFSVRAAYEMMYLTSQALAPNQATFITDFSYLNTSQDPFYHGASFGFEGYW